MKSESGKLRLLEIIKQVHFLYEFLSLHTSSCNENRTSNINQHHIPKYANPCRVVYKPCSSFVTPKCLLKVAGLDKNR